MRLVPLTPLGSHFVQAEIVDRFDDDIEAYDRPHFFNAAEIVRDHMERSGGKSLAVVPHVDAMVLEVLNALDDAIVGKRTEREFGLDGRAARALHKSGSAIYSQVLRELHGRTSGVARTARVRTKSIAIEVVSAVAYVSSRLYPEVPPEWRRARAIVHGVKEGDAAALDDAATMIAHLCRGFRGIVAPVPRSAPGRPSLMALCQRIVARGVGREARVIVERARAVTSSRELRRADREAISIAEHVASMRLVATPDAPVLFVDDMFTEGRTITAVARVVGRSIHAATVGYYIEPSFVAEALTRSPFVPHRRVLHTRSS